MLLPRWSKCARGVASSCILHMSLVPGRTRVAWAHQRSPAARWCCTVCDCCKQPPAPPPTLVKGPGRGGGGKGRGLRGITKVVSPAEPWAGLKWIFLKSKPKSKCSGDVRVARTVHPQVSVTVKYPPRARG